MTSITAPTYDPTTTATAMAQKETSSAQELITNQTSAATATAKALKTLGSAISSFQTSLSSLTGIGKSMLAQSAALSDATVGKATASASASAGSYSLFVKQLATASQKTYAVTDGALAQGTLRIALSATDTSATAPAFTVDLSQANTDSTPGLSAREVAAAINQAPGNNGRVSAGVATVNGVQQIVLTSKNTGADNTVWMSASSTGGTPDYALGSAQTLVAAQDASFWFGGQNGTEIVQSSNTFTAIDGVSFTATRAQAASESDLQLTVSGDTGTTTSNVQAFVDAYNKLKSAVDASLDPGDAKNNTAAGAFAHDAGVQALQGRLVSMLRTGGSPSLATYGITAARDGTLKLDSTRLNKQLAANPDGLDKLIGSASISNPTGVAGALDKYLDQWSNTLTGQIKSRTDANDKLQTTLTKRQADLQTHYDAAYQRYLKQFTALQSLQSTMNGNVSMFDAMFGSDKSS